MRVTDCAFRRSASTTVLSVSVVLAAGCGPADERGEDIGTAGHHLGVELGDRGYDLFAPEEVEGGEAIPAVLVLHGSPGSPATAQSDSGMDELAEEEGFLAVYPEGSNEKWDAAPVGTDLGYVDELIDDLVANWNADPQGVYVSGFSNGADMTLVIAAELPDRVAGIAPVAPSNTGQALRTVREMDPPAVPTIAFLGGRDDRLDVGSELMERWRSGSGCGAEETAEEEDLVTSTWECDEGTEVVVHRVENGGHQWFGDADRPEPLWASAALWEFFAVQG